MREVAREHELLAVAAQLGHGAHHGHGLARHERERAVERMAGAIGRQSARDGEDVARDVAAVRGEEAIEVRMHLPEIDAAFDRIGQLFIGDGVESRTAAIARRRRCSPSIVVVTSQPMKPIRAITEARTSAHRPTAT